MVRTDSMVIAPKCRLYGVCRLHGGCCRCRLWLDKTKVCLSQRALWPKAKVPKAVVHAVGCRLCYACSVVQAQRFVAIVLLPHVRKDIRENKKLHFALFQSLKKACYKPDAFYKVRPFRYFFTRPFKCFL